MPDQNNYSSYTLSSMNSLQIVVFAFLTGYLSIALHEFGHWLILEILGKGPVMGFSGLVQSWDTTPKIPSNWIHITYKGADGWLRLGSAPTGAFEWGIILGAGPLITLLLAWSGYLLLTFSDSPKIRFLGLSLTLVNTVGVFLFPINYILGSGDFSFMASYLSVPLPSIAFPYEMLRVIALLLTFSKIRRWENWRRWTGLILSGYIMVLPVMFLDKLIRFNFVHEGPLAKSFTGWATPVLIAHILSLLVFLDIFKKISNSTLCK